MDKEQRRKEFIKEMKSFWSTALLWLLFLFVFIGMLLIIELNLIP